LLYYEDKGYVSSIVMLLTASLEPEGLYLMWKDASSMLNKSLILLAGLFPSIAFAQQNLEGKEKSDDDPTKVTTQVGLS
ncbi:hypothetical protein, partial [Klebsiella aerogenes]|uniref:hypothetical protein n=1 Tax=Klebsiella aerogenes TaxID=548 RepID=UPI001D0D8E89